MSRWKRLNDAIARRSEWLLLAILATGLVLCAKVVRREHLHDECLPATCTVREIMARPEGPARWMPVVRYRVESSEGEPMGKFWTSIGPAVDTRERALQVGDEWTHHRPTFDCYYHPVYRDYLTTEPSGHWILPLVFGVVFLLGVLVLTYFQWLDWRDRGRPEGRAPPFAFDGSHPFPRLFRARDFIPDSPPPGWSVPIKLRDRDCWLIDVGGEGLMVELVPRGPFWAVRAYITTRGAAKLPPAEALPSDSRCAEILGHLEGLGEWIECAPLDQYATRGWLAFPRAQRPRFTVPEGLPFPPRPVSKPRLAAARKHLPDKVPEGWSLPVAITEDYGTTWKDGGWIMAVDDTLMAIVALCSSEGRDKLAVSLFHRDGSEVVDTEAVDVLRHFRGVYEFHQGVRPAEAPFVLYLGEITVRRRDPATLN